MFSGDDSLPTAVMTAQERDLKPLVADSAEVLDLDLQQVGEMEMHLHEAWFFGIKTGHKVMVETKMGQSDPMPSLLSLQDEFQDLMEGLAEALNLTVQGTLVAWNYLGDAWIAGAKFWEVEILARLIESQSGEVEEWLRRWLGE